MRKEALSFLHDSNARRDVKIMRMMVKYGQAGYGLFWCIVEALREQSDFRYPIDQLDVLAMDVRPGDIDLREFIDYCTGLELFISENGCFYSNSLICRMENYRNAKIKKSLAGRKGSSVKWDKSSDDYEYTNIRSKRLAEAREKGRHTKEEWEKMKSFFKNCCVFCGGEVVDGPIKDHIIPIYQGGSDGIDNIQPACRGCNSSKGSDSTDMRIQYCEESGLKMPGEWLPMHYQCTDLLKERKGKEEYNITKKNRKEDNKRRLKQLFNSDIQINVADKVIEYLNTKTGKNYELIEEYVIDLVNRQNEGVKLNEFIKVIDVKLIDPHFKRNPQFMNPKTLFIQPNFDKYRNQSIEDFKQKSTLQEQREQDVFRHSGGTK